MSGIGERLAVWWQHLGSMWDAAITSLGNPSGGAVATLIGAVVGGIIAGVTTWLVQRMAIREARTERIAAKRQADLAVALTTITKVIKILSAFRGMHIEFAQAKARLAEPGFNLRRPWEVLQPFATSPSGVKFDAGEAGFLLGTKVKPIMLTSMELADVYNDMLEMLGDYGGLRQEFARAMPAVVVDGRIEATPMDLETSTKLSLITVPLEGLFRALMGRIELDYAQAKMVFFVLREHCAQRFGSDFPPLEFIEGPAAAEAAAPGTGHGSPQNETPSGPEH